MLGNRAIIDAVARVLPSDLPIVVDPVMVATSGHRLLEPEAEEALVSLLLPRATVLTPNLHEAAVLSRLPLEAPADSHAAAIASLAPKAWVIIKGGHRISDAPDTDFRCAVDVLRSPSGELTRVSTPWLETTSTHGTGCTLSAAIASQLALGLEVFDAIIEARRYLLGALSAAVPVGQGHGPVDHLFALVKTASQA
jgi:hydroxymethylpyrimidine/phosphomethylpyrimidine kinase